MRMYFPTTETWGSRVNLRVVVDIYLPFYPSTFVCLCPHFRRCFRLWNGFFVLYFLPVPSCWSCELSVSVSPCSIFHGDFHRFQMVRHRIRAVQFFPRGGGGVSMETPWRASIGGKFLRHSWFVRSFFFLRLLGWRVVRSSNREFRLGKLVLFFIVIGIYLVFSLLCSIILRSLYFHLQW